MALELNLAVERLLYSGDMQEKRGERKEEREERKVRRTDANAWLHSEA